VQRGLVLPSQTKAKALLGVGMKTLNARFSVQLANVCIRKGSKGFIQPVVSGA
jgi:hypothetical protein